MTEQLTRIMEGYKAQSFQSHSTLANPSSDAPLGTFDDRQRAMKSEWVEYKIGRAVPEHDGITFFWTNFQSHSWERSFTPFINFRKIYNDRCKSVSSRTKERKTLGRALEPIGVLLVFLTWLISKQIKYLTILLRQERPFFYTI